MVPTMFCGHSATISSFCVWNESAPSPLIADGSKANTVEAPGVPVFVVNPH